MSQQPHDLGYLDYNPPNRSPSSSRQPYGASGFASGMSLPRQSQRGGYDSPVGAPNMYTSDRAASGYNPRTMDTMSSGVPLYMLDNGQSWNYNTSGAATVNGPMGGATRQRGSARRGVLPPTWTDQGMGMPNSNTHNLQQFASPLNGNTLSNSSLRMDHASGHGSPTDMRSSTSDPDQLIPTAIVIKNIPFAVRKETLASIMLDMHLPQPYAFNYHFDNGVFRGLAFANFQSAEDTRIVIEAMNGMDVHGRKLRVEYKKMLPEAERERIEREKRERRGQLEEQHRAPMLHQQSSIQSLGAMSQGQGSRPAHLATPTPSEMPPRVNRLTSPVGDVDMNDPQTLEFYSDLLLFKRDESREILVFPPGIAPEHRRSIHILAHHMGLQHQSIGEAESRQLTVLKGRQPSPTENPSSHPLTSLDVHKRGLSRAATFDFAADRESRVTNSSYAHMMGRQGPTLELPGSPDANGIPNNLRAAKSFADLRSFTPSPSQASSGYLAPGSGMPTQAARFGDYLVNVPHQHSASPGIPKNDIVSGMSGLGLGSYDSGSLPSQSRLGPGAIGSQRPGANGSSVKNVPDRQPRGPEWEASAGFGGRGRSNGHMSRDSESSDNGARIVTGTASNSRYH